MEYKASCYCALTFYMWFEYKMSTEKIVKYFKGYLWMKKAIKGLSGNDSHKKGAIVIFGQEDIMYQQ